MAATWGNFRAEKDPEIEAVLQRLEVEEAESQDTSEARSNHPLDQEKAVDLWNKLRSWFSEERERQSATRVQQAIDEDFYDHLQWADEDLIKLAERGQAPLVFNRISLAVNWLYGTAMRTRTDWKVRPREPGDEQLAPVKTKVLKYVSDVNYAANAQLQAFKEALKVGIGWIDVGIDTDPTSELLRLDHESWRNVWHDSRGGKKIDCRDDRYVFRMRWIDEDMGTALFPDRADLIRECSTSEDAMVRPDDDWSTDESSIDTGYGGTTDTSVFATRSGVADAFGVMRSRRKRLRLVECWYRVPERKETMKGPIFDGQPYNPANPTMKQAVEQGVCSVIGHVAMHVRYAIWCEKGLLAEGPSPYKHNRFPLIRVTCYRRGRDGMYYGVVRGMRDAQEDLNKRASKALHILSTRGVIFEQGAFEDEDEAREEFARPDYFIGKNRGYEVKTERDVTLAQGHLDLMDRDAMHMEASSGVTNELVAMQTQAVSGKAIEKRQQQGQLTTTEPFENFRLAKQFAGEIMLSLVEQFYSEPKTFRIIGDKGRDEFVEINKPKFDEAANEWSYVNDITSRHADFVVGEQDFRESIRIAQYETTMEFLTRLPPEVGMKFLDLAIELSDMENKDEWLKRLREMNGIPNPEGPQTPEEQQAAEAAAKRAQMMEAIETATLETTLAKLQAEVAKLQAEGKKVDSASILDRINAIKAAVEAAVNVVSVPAVTPAADVLLDGAGFPTAIQSNASPAGPPMPSPSMPAGGAPVPMAA